MKKFSLWEGGPTLIQAEHAPLTSDTVALAHFARVGEGEQGADLGCASGALMLILLSGHAGLRMTGLELDAKAAEQARTNLEENGLSDRAAVLTGDMRETSKQLPAASCDFVIVNPPYYSAGRGAISPTPERAAAYSETDITLEEICRVAGRLCRNGGRLFLSWRPERLTELFTAAGSCGMEIKRLRFVHHSADRAAFTVLAEAHQGGGPGLTVEAPLFLHDPDGRESEEYRRICRRENR